MRGKIGWDNPIPVVGSQIRTVIGLCCWWENVVYSTKICFQIKKQDGFFIYPHS